MVYSELTKAYNKNGVLSKQFVGGSWKKISEYEDIQSKLKRTCYIVTVGEIDFKIEHFYNKERNFSIKTCKLF